MYLQVKKGIRHLLEGYTRRVIREECEDQRFARNNERAIEYAFLFRQIAALSPRRVLDVGTGVTALPHLIRTCGPVVTAIDNVRDYWPDGMTNRHFLVLDDDITDSRLSGPFDLITCISALEHMERANEAMRNMFRLLSPGGHVILTFPYSEHEFVPNVYELPDSSYGQDVPYFTRAYSRAELDRWLEESGATLVSQEFWQCWSGEHWTVGTALVPPRRVDVGDRHQLTCVVLRGRVT